MPTSYPTKSEPQVLEVSANFSAGGKVSIVKYDVSSDYHVSISKKYAIPEDWDDERATDFLLEKYDEIRSMVDERSDNEFEARFEQSYLNKG